MSRMATPASYIATWVKAPWPVQSPTAHRPSPARVRLSQLQADRAAAQHDQRPGQLLGLDRLLVRPERRAGQPVDGRDDRGRADGEHHPPPYRQSLALGLDRPRTGQARGAADEPA